MKNKTQTAIAKDIKTALHSTEKHATIAETAAEQARLYAAAGREHATVAESAAEQARISADSTREMATRAKAYSATACNHANRADDNAKRAELNAEDAATYAGAARICLLLTIIFNAIFLTILYCIR